MTGESIFFSLLRSGLYAAPIPEDEQPEHIDWDYIESMSVKHGVFGIIINGVQYLPENLRPPEELYARMSKFAMGLIQANLILDRTAGRLSAVLDEHGINGVLLKGQGIARLYRMPQMRQTGDIDYYVGRRQYREAVEICRKFLIKNKSPWHETGLHFVFKMDGVEIELHRIASFLYSPSKNRRFQRWTEEELEHSPRRRRMDGGGSDVVLPSLDFDAIYIFYHAWHHFVTGGIGLRQLCDWAMIFHYYSGEIDTEKLKENIRRFGMTNGWRLFACIVVDHLGVSKDSIPLYDTRYRKKSEKVLKDIMEGGNFGYHAEATVRMMSAGYGLRNDIKKVSSLLDYFISLFTIVPKEATFIFFKRLFSGTFSSLNRMLRKQETKQGKQSRQ